MQTLTPGAVARVPGMSMLPSAAAPYPPVEKPAGAAGYSQPATATVKQLVPYSSAGSQARAGIGIGGATNTPKPTPAATTTTTSGGGSGAQSIYNLDTDPVVQKIKALNANNYAGAVSNAQAGAKQDLIGAGFNFGDIIAAHPELAAGILGSVLGDQATAEAAQQNPFSTAAQLAQSHNQNVHAIDQNDNAANLYYSSTRANQLGDEAHGYLGNVASEQDRVAQALAALISGVTGEQTTENQNLGNAYDTARENAVTNAINSGEVLAGYDQNGNPVFTSAPATSGNSPGSSNTPAAPAAATVATLAAALAPVAKKATANKTGASANRRQGVFSIH